MRRRGIIGAVFIGCVISGHAAAVCLVPAPVGVCTEFSRSDDVIQGKILSERKFPDSPDPNNIEGWFYKIAVDKSWRGDAKGTIEIYTGNDETHFPMEVGRSYILFVNRNPEGRLAPDVCGNSTDLAQGTSVLNAIAEIQQAEKAKSGGYIEGRVNLPMEGTETISNAGLPGASFTAHADTGKDYTATSEQDGRFQMHVPAGHYSVAVDAAKWSVAPYALSYMKGDFDIPDGGCADLQYLAEPK